MKSFASAKNDTIVPDAFAASGNGKGLRFYVTAAQPCPYLPDQIERKGFTYLTGRNLAAQHDQLSQAGFRRYQNTAYRPLCPNCNACRSVRVIARAFRPGSGFRRVLRVNQDLVCRRIAPVATRESYRLFKNYVTTRHGGEGMCAMNFRAFSTMMTDSPVQTAIFEYRYGTARDAPLVAVALTDMLNDGLSMIYTFFDPRMNQRGLGTYMILDHIRHCSHKGLPHVYLGYWIRDSRKMDYKRRFAPLEILDGGRWKAFNADENDTYSFEVKP